MHAAAIGEVSLDTVVYSDTLQSCLDACTGIVLNVKLAADELNSDDYSEGSVKLIEAIDVGFANILKSLENISILLDGVSGDLDIAFGDTQAAMKALINLLDTANPLSFNAEVDLIIVDLTTALSDLLDTSRVISENVFQDAGSDVEQALIALELVMQAFIGISKYTLASVATVIETKTLVKQPILWTLANSFTETFEEVHLLLSDIHLIELNPTGTAKKRDVKDEL